MIDHAYPCRCRINPAVKSVAAGHYYRDNYSQKFFRRPSKAGLLPGGDGFEDARSFRGRHRLHRRRQALHGGQGGLRCGELEHGRTILGATRATLDVPLVIFVVRSAAEALLGPLPPHSYGLVPRRRLGPRPIFVMPHPRPRARSSPMQSKAGSAHRVVRTPGAPA